MCQLGSPRAVNAFLQRVGRAGHAIGAIPKGRLFPLSLDDLLECTALLDAVQRGELDRIRVPASRSTCWRSRSSPKRPAANGSSMRCTSAAGAPQPYRELTLQEFEQVVQMLADGYSTRRGRRGAYLHYDAVNRVLRARRGARLAAVTNAGVIPDQFDYDVVLLPEEHRVGTLNEDFAFESLPGDIFQLGNTSYRIAKVETGKVLVEDAKGQPPTMPFWLGEAWAAPTSCATRCRGLARPRTPVSTTASRPASAGCTSDLQPAGCGGAAARAVPGGAPRPRSACCPASGASCSSASSTRSATRTW